MKMLRLWFWTPVREQENWAQTLVRVAGNLFRIATTAIAMIAAALGLSIYLQSQQESHRAQQARMIVVSANAKFEGEGKNGCTPQFPLAIVVRNDSSQTLMSMDITVSAREPGTSRNVLNYGESDIRWDHIVPPPPRPWSVLSPGQ